jgi:hypothetical protein
MVAPSQRSDPMAEHGPTIGRDTAGGWGRGFAIFAGVMMIILGVFHFLEGLTAILQDKFFVSTPNYIITVDVSTWGWAYLIGGAIVAVAGFFVLSGALWARAIGILLAGLSAIANFLFIPYYPIWSVLMIALDVFVIWALAVHGREVAA